jgi:hypothetical protein
MTIPENTFTRNTSALIKIREPKPKPRFWDGRKHVCNYDYRAPDGRVVFRKQRFSLDPELWGREKDFSVLTPSPVTDPFKPTVWRSGGPEGIADWLYRLPEVLAAIERNVFWVHWAEGEKDADALWEHGLVGTTNATGAAKLATDEQARWIKNASGVVIWMDKGEGKALALGAWNAATRYNALVRVGVEPSRIQVVKARHVKDKDAFDHLARYGVKADPINVSTKKLVEMASAHRPGTAWKQGYPDE